MADASAISFLFDGLTALHGGPLDDASGFIFYRELYGHLDGMVKRFGFDLFGRMLAWVSVTATSLLTFWIWVEGYRIVIGRSQRSMMVFLTEMVQAVTITFLAAGAALGGTTLYDWVGHDLGRMVHRVVTGQTGDVFESIDRTLGYMQLAFGFIDEIQTGGSEVLQQAKERNMGIVAVGMGGPAVIAGALLLTYKLALALCLGFAPLFVLCLLFPQTKPLFWGWLNQLVGALFALSVLHVMAAIATNMICAVAATFWTAKLTGASVEGVNSLAMQQGGLGLLLTTLIIGAPLMAARFFKALLGDFSPYSAFGHGGASQTSAAHSPHSHAPTYMHSGERAQAPVQTHAHRVVAPARTTAQEPSDTRSFLERFPNATVSLGTQNDGGDALPEDVRVSAESGNAIKGWGAGLGRSIDDIAALSKTLQEDVAKLNAADWSIKYGANGGGSMTSRDIRNLRIEIDGKWRDNPKESCRALAHEVGHATNPYVENYSSKEAYVRGALNDEATALLKNIQIQREILAATNGEINIGINGTAVNHEAYNAAYDQYLFDRDIELAKLKIAEIFGNKEFSSVGRESGKLSYREYYENEYEKRKRR